MGGACFVRWTTGTGSAWVGAQRTAARRAGRLRFGLHRSRPACGTRCMGTVMLSNLTLALLNGPESKTKHGVR
jgi:hypothetical protein